MYFHRMEAKARGRRGRRAVGADAEANADEEGDGGEVCVPRRMRAELSRRADSSLRMRRRTTRAAKGKISIPDSCESRAAIPVTNAATRARGLRSSR